MSAPLAASVVRAATDHYIPASDWALEELQVRAVGTSATPLLGAWSRFGWRHPGPVLFYLLAVPYRLFGSAPLGIQVGVVVLNGAAMLFTLLLLRRHGRVAFLLGALGLLLLQFGLYDNHLRDEWNVAVCVFPFVVLLVAAWASLEGSALGITLVPLAATFVMQSHIGYVPASLPALVVWLYALREHRTVDRLRRLARRSVLVCGVAWLPVMLDALLHGGGNLRKIASWSMHHGREPTVGLRTTLRIVGDVTSSRVPFVRGLRTSYLVLDTRSVGVAPLLVLGLLVVVLILSIVTKVRRRDAVSLDSLLLATWVVVGLAVVRITGPLYPHLFWLLLPLAMLSWVAVALTIHRLARPPSERLRRVAAVTLVGCLVSSAALATVRIAQSDVLWIERRAAVIRLSDAARAYLHGRSTVVIDRVGDYENEGGVQAGMIAHLDHDGITALVSPLVVVGDSTRHQVRTSLQFTSDRIDHHTTEHVVMVVTGPGSLLAPPGRLLAQVDPLTAAERKEWLDDYSRARTMLAAARRLDLAPILATTGAPLVVFSGAPQLAAISDRLNRLAALNGRGPADFLWLAQDPQGRGA